MSMTFAVRAIVSVALSPCVAIYAKAAAEKPVPRGWIWIADYNYQRTDLEQRCQVVDFSGRSTLVRLPEPGPLSPDGQQIAWALRNKDGLRVMQADLRSGVAPTVQGEPRQIFGIDLPTQGMHLDSYVSALAWSPNSVYLALSVRDTRVGDTYTHRLADRHGKVVEIECGAGDDGQWSPNGSRYACGLKNGKLVIFEPPTGGRVERFTAADATDFLSNIHWSPDGTAIALFHGRMAKGPEGGPASRSLVTIDVNSGKESVLIPDIDAVVGKRWTPGDIQWSPNGKLISFSTREELFLLDVMTRRVKKLVVTNQIERVKEQELALMDCPRWSLDGEALVFQFHIGERFTDEGHIHDRALYVYDLRSQKARKLLDKPMGWCLEILPRSPSSLPR